MNGMLAEGGVHNPFPVIFFGGLLLICMLICFLCNNRCKSEDDEDEDDDKDNPSK